MKAPFVLGAVLFIAGSICGFMGARLRAPGPGGTPAAAGTEMNTASPGAQTPLSASATPAGTRPAIDRYAELKRLAALNFNQAHIQLQTLVASMDAKEILEILKVQGTSTGTAVFREPSMRCSCAWPASGRTRRCVMPNPGNRIAARS